MQKDLNSCASLWRRFFLGKNTVYDKETAAERGHREIPVKYTFSAFLLALGAYSEARIEKSRDLHA